MSFVCLWKTLEISKLVLCCGTWLVELPPIDSSFMMVFRPEFILVVTPNFNAGKEPECGLLY